MNNFEQNNEINKKNPEIIDKIEKEKTIEAKELSVEQFAEIVSKNGSIMDSELGGEYVIDKKSIVNNLNNSKKETQAVYLFNGELYLIYFDMNTNEMHKNSPKDQSEYTFSPKNICKLKNPTEKNK